MLFINNNNNNNKTLHLTEGAATHSQGHKIKLLWDFTVQCDHRIEHRKPDIVLVDESAGRALIIDIAVPGDARVLDKEVEKCEKYQLLAREIYQLWRVKAEVVPVVVGTLGTVSEQHLPAHLDKIGIGKYCSVGLLQKAALLGSATILRKVLDM